MRNASPDVTTARRCGSEKRLPSGSGCHQDRGIPGIIPSVEAALYKINVNGTADVPHNGRRCQHYPKLRGLNSEQREERDEGLIFIIAAAPTMVSHDLAKTAAVAMGLWRARRYGRYRGQGRQSASGAYGREQPRAARFRVAADHHGDHRSRQRCLLARGGSQRQGEQGLS
jgi:hypothetical protein